MKIEDIKNPKFLKHMNNKNLNILSNDIREFLIDNISKTGGHLSSNLGIVELTVAIEKVFDTKKDKLIFDVGHQCYVHKILTGRAKDFNTLRKLNGLCGFQKRTESLYDCYEAGHSSTSLSAALGFALTRDHNKTNENVIAVIGDGSIGNGLAYEALNHIGSLNTKLIVILNDNNMSISKNVGALHNSMDKIRSNFKYDACKNDTKSLLHKLPYIGDKLASGITLIKESFKKIYMKEGYLFSEFGFTYYGPINGHDYDELLLYLEMAKKETKPVLLHVITEKGKGYKPAEEDTLGAWHGVSPFDKTTGKFLTKPTDLISYSEAVSNNLINLTKINKNIMAITPAMTSGSKLTKYKELYPNNFIDVGIAEEHALVMATSMGLSGLKPFVSIYSTFLQRGYDEILHDIARMKSPVVIGVDRAGIVGEDGETHQGIYDISFLSHIPNMIIAHPKDSNELGNMMYTAFNQNKPFAIRYSKHKTKYEEIEYKKIEIGSWEQVKKGSDLTIISYGTFLDNAVKISDKLKEDGIKAEVVNARFIKPYDEEYFNKLLKKNKKIFIYEETASIGSLGSRLLYYANKVEHKSKIYNYAIADKFVKHGSYNQIIKSLGLDIDTIYNDIKEKMK